MSEEAVTADAGRAPGSPGGGVTADLRGRVAVVTGASSGLGARFAEVLAGGGATSHSRASSLTNGDHP